MEARRSASSPIPVVPHASWSRRLKYSVWVILLLASGVLSGCFLGENDEDGEGNRDTESY